MRGACWTFAGAIGIALLLGWPGAGFAQRPASQEEVEEINAAAEKIMARPEFRRVREKRIKPVETPADDKPAEKQSLEKSTPQQQDDVRDAPGRSEEVNPAMGSFFGSILSAFSQLLVILAYTLLAVIAVGIIWFLFKRFQSLPSLEKQKPAEKFDEGDAGTAPGEIAADEYLRRAMELAQQQNYREAIAQLVLGAKSHAERQGLIRFRRGLTHRDYIRAFRPQPQQQSALRQIVGVYEPICFGRRTATLDQYEFSVSGYQGGFGHA